MNHVTIHLCSQSHLQQPWTGQVAGSGKLGVNMLYQPNGLWLQGRIVKAHGLGPGQLAVLWLRCGWMPTPRAAAETEGLWGREQVEQHLQITSWRLSAIWTYTICLLNTARARRGDGKETQPVVWKRDAHVGLTDGKIRFNLHCPPHVRGFMAEGRTHLLTKQTLQCKCMEIKHSFKRSVWLKQLNDKMKISTISFSHFLRKTAKKKKI